MRGEVLSQDAVACPRPASRLLGVKDPAGPTGDLPGESSYIRSPGGARNVAYGARRVQIPAGPVVAVCVQAKALLIVLKVRCY